MGPIDSEEAVATLGAVLAGGRGSRLGGDKATVDLAGRPLISYALAALTAAGLDPFVVAKLTTAADLSPVTDPGAPQPGQKSPGRPRRDGTVAGPVGDVPTAGEGSGAGEAEDQATAVEVVTEPAEPTHPLTGIVAALRHAGRPVVVLGCDFPFVPPPLLRALADAPEPLVVPAPAGDVQPLVARWSPTLLPDLEAALTREEPLRRTVTALSPRLLTDAELAHFGDPARTFFNVNTPADLRAAADLL